MGEYAPEAYERSAEGSAGAALGQEAALLAHARHPGVVELRGTHVDPDAHGRTTIVTIRPEGQTLAGRALEADELAGVVAVLATTIADLHDIGVAHGGLRPEVVVVTEGGRPVIDDFSAARWLEGPVARRATHPLARADDSALGAIIQAPLAVGPGTAPHLVTTRRRRPSALGDRLAGNAAVTLARGAAGLEAGRLTSRQLADLVVREIPEARLPGTTESWGSLRSTDDGPTTSPSRRSAGRAILIGAAVAALATLAALAPATTAALVTFRARPSHRVSSLARDATLTPPGRPACPPGQAEVETACARLSYADGVATVGTASFAVGAPGDVITTGRWHCGPSTLALLDPATGQVWTFSGWPTTSTSVTATLVETVRGAVDISTSAGTDCDAIAVRQADGATAVITTARWP